MSRREAGHGARGGGAGAGGGAGGVGASEVTADVVFDLLELLGRPGVSASGDALCRQVVVGLRPVLGVDAAGILLVRGSRLETVGRHGLLPRGVLAGGAIGLDAGHVAARCVREGEIVVDAVAAVSAVGAARSEAGAGAESRRGGRSVVGVPVVVRGRPVGALVVAAPPVGWTVRRVRTLQAVADTVGLWAPPGVPSAGQETGEVVVSARQARIVALIGEERSNPQIAAALGCSVSTVKGEVQALLRALRCPDRHGIVAAATARGLVVRGGAS